MKEQIVDLAFTVTGSVQLDVARAQEDPWWDQYSRGRNLDDPAEFEQVVRDYVSAYLRNEQLLSNNAPWTCGPASLYHIQIEVRNGGSNTNNERK